MEARRWILLFLVVFLVRSGEKLISDDVLSHVEQDLGRCMHADDPDGCDHVFALDFLSLDANGDDILDYEELKPLFRDMIEGVLLPAYFPSDDDDILEYPYFCDNFMQVRFPKVSDEVSAEVLEDICDREYASIHLTCSFTWVNLFPDNPHHVTRQQMFDVYFNALLPPGTEWDFDTYLAFVEDDAVSNDIHDLFELAKDDALDLVPVDEYTESVNDCETQYLSTELEAYLGNMGPRFSSDKSKAVGKRRRAFVFVIAAVVIATSATSAAVTTVSSGGGIEDFGREFAANAIGGSITLGGCYMTAGLGCAAAGAVGGMATMAIGSIGCGNDPRRECYSFTDYVEGGALGALTAGKLQAKMPGIRNVVKLKGTDAYKRELGKLVKKETKKTARKDTKKAAKDWWNDRWNGYGPYAGYGYRSDEESEIGGAMTATSLFGMLRQVPRSQILQVFRTSVIVVAGVLLSYFGINFILMKYSTYTQIEDGTADEI